VTTPTETLVWTEGSGRHTAEEVVAEFARQHWGHPRETTPIRDNRFRMIDGVAIYAVRLEPGGLWKIYREEVVKQPRPVEATK
jgi:hypothetical protein